MGKRRASERDDRFGMRVFGHGEENGDGGCASCSLLHTNDNGLQAEIWI